MIDSAMFPISFEAPRPGFYAWLAGIFAAPILSFLLAYFYYVPNTIKVRPLPSPPPLRPSNH